MKPTPHYFRSLAVSAVLGLSAHFVTAQPFNFTSRFAAANGGGEIVVHDRFAQLLYTTSGSTGVQLINFANPAAPTSVTNINLTGVFGGSQIFSVSSVAADPLGRGFGVASVIPGTAAASSDVLGKVVFFNPTSGSVLHTLDVGYHPDMVTFSPDGSKLLVANEGEPSATANRAGSVSSINLSSVSSAAQVPSLTAGSVTTVDFSSLDLSGIRVLTNSAAPNRHLDIEPEYITVQGNAAYISLQENNAIATFDLNTLTFTGIRNLGTINTLIDASDQDGTINMNDSVRGMPMPDGLASFTRSGTRYVVTANEGDARSNAAATGDEARVSQLGASGRPPIDPTVLSNLSAAYGSSATATNNLGRLTVSMRDNISNTNFGATVTGDIDNDGDIDRLTTFGTRSFSIWNADSGALVYDSSNLLDSISISLGTYLDNRSDDKGAEPEYVAVGELYGRTYAFVGLERSGGVAQFDITDLTNVTYVAYLIAPGENVPGGALDIGPEGLQFISNLESPDGKAYLIVANEVSSTITTFEVVPEPSTYALVLTGVAVFALSMKRRKR